MQEIIQQIMITATGEKNDDSNISKSALLGTFKSNSSPILLYMVTEYEINQKTIIEIAKGKKTNWILAAEGIRKLSTHKFFASVSLSFLFFAE